MLNIFPCDLTKSNVFIIAFRHPILLKLQPRIFQEDEFLSDLNKYTANSFDHEYFQTLARINLNSKTTYFTNK